VDGTLKCSYVKQYFYKFHIKPATAAAGALSLAWRHWDLGGRGRNLNDVNLVRA